MEPIARGDDELATTMRRMKVPAPVEQIAYTDWLLTALNREKLGERRRVVVLACGHHEVTANSRSCRCAKCHAMILNGEDYEAFRNRT